MRTNERPKTEGAGSSPGVGARTFQSAATPENQSFAKLRSASTIAHCRGLESPRSDQASRRVDSRKGSLGPRTQNFAAAASFDRYHGLRAGRAFGSNRQQSAIDTISHRSQRLAVFTNTSDELLMNFIETQMTSP